MVNGKNNIWIGLLLFFIASLSQANDAKGTSLYQAELWRPISFNHIARTVYDFKQDSIEASVNASSSSIVYPLPKENGIRTLNVEGSLRGQAVAELKNPLDYYLRLGVLLEGEKSFSFFERLFLAGWVKEMLSFFETPTFGSLTFYEVCTDEAALGKKRLADYGFEEMCTAVPDVNARFSFRVNLKPSEHLKGIWLQSDGDDSQVQYTASYKLKLK